MTAAGGTDQSRDQATVSRRFLWLCRGAILFLGAAQTTVTRNTMNVDGLSYLDIATEYVRGNTGSAITGHWSPFYSWLIAGVFWLGNPSPQWEFAVVHALNLVVFVVALAAFEFFLRELYRDAESFAGAALAPLENVWWVLGYACFGYSSLVLINLGHVGSDLLLSAIVYATAAILLRFSRMSGVSLQLAGLLGVLLGVGYLIKAVMLPLAAVTIVILAVVLRRRRGGARASIVAGLAFLVVALPWIVALSGSKGRFTIGDAGKLNAAWHVEGVRLYRHWQGDSLNGTPVHPTRTLSSEPTIYEFASPVAGTYPVWFDPSYWYEGVTRRGDMLSQLRTVFKSMHNLLEQQWFYPVLVAILAAWFSTGVRQSVAGLSRTWPVVVLALAGIGAYSLLLLLGRYVAPFVAVTIPTLLLAAANRRDAATPGSMPRLNPLVGALAFVLMAMVTYQIAITERGTSKGNPHFGLAQAIQAAGVPRGSDVGVIGESSDAYWARLAGARVVAEITPEENLDFWAGSPALKAAILEQFRGAGVVAVVANQVPPWANTVGWTSLGNNGYWINSFSGP